MKRIMRQTKGERQTAARGALVGEAETFDGLYWYYLSLVEAPLSKHFIKYISYKTR